MGAGPTRQYKTQDNTGVLNGNEISNNISISNIDLDLDILKNQLYLIIALLIVIVQVKERDA